MMMYLDFTWACIIASPGAIHISGNQAAGASSVERLAAIPLGPCRFPVTAAQAVGEPRGPTVLLSWAQGAFKANQEGEATGNHSRTKMTGGTSDVTKSGRLPRAGREELLSVAPGDTTGMNGQKWRRSRSSLKTWLLETSRERNEWPAEVEFPVKSHVQFMLRNCNGLSLQKHSTCVDSVVSNENK